MEKKEMTREEKDKIVDGFAIITAKHTLELFSLLGIKTHLVCTVENGTDRYVFSFVKVESREIKTTKISVSDWINNAPKGASVRLLNCLKSNVSSDKYYPYNNGIDFIEDYTRRKFLKIRNGGQKSWEEFCKLTGRENSVQWD